MDLSTRDVIMIRMLPVGLALGIVVMSTAASAQDQVQAGQKVYMAQKCSVCHSIGGAGNKKGPLDSVGAKLSADQIRMWITDAPAMTAKTNATRKPPMKSYTLPKEELDSLVAYLASLKK